MIKKQPIRVEHWHKITALLLVYDFVAAICAYFLALWFRFDCRISVIDGDYIHVFLRFAPVYGLITLAVFWGCRLYRSIWRFASFTELKRIENDRGAGIDTVYFQK